MLLQFLLFVVVANDKVGMYINHGIPLLFREGFKKLSTIGKERGGQWLDNMQFLFLDTRFPQRVSQ